MPYNEADTRAKLIDPATHRCGWTEDLIRREETAIDKAEAKFKELTRESKDLAAKAKDIEDAVYDLKAVNPNRKPVVDTRTPEELMDIIEEKGREVAHALAVLREGMKGMTDKRPQTIQFFLPQGKLCDVHWAESSVRIVGPFRKGRYDCGGVQAVVVYSEPMP